MCSSDLLARTPLPTIAPLTCSALTTRISRPGLSGRFHLGVVVDPEQTLDEALESNNNASSDPVYIGAFVDLAITKVWAVSTYDFAMVLEAEVCNHGPTSPSQVGVEFYLTKVPGRLEGASPTPIAGYFIDGVLANVPPSGKCTVISTGPVRSYAPVGASYFPAAHLPPLRDQYAPNDWKAGEEFTVTNGGVDLEVVSVTVGSGKVSALICNRGGSTSFTWPHFYESEDDNLVTFYSNQTGPEDRWMGQFPLGNLEPGQCTTVQIPHTPSKPWVRIGVEVEPDSNPLNDRRLSPVP